MSKKVLSSASDGCSGSSREVMTIAETAALLGLSVNKTYTAARRGQIPGVLRIGRTYRISRRAVMAWLDGATPGRRP